MVRLHGGALLSVSWTSRRRSGALSMQIASCVLYSIALSSDSVGNVCGQSSAAWAEGRMVAPSLSVVADYTQSEKASCAASKGSYREALLSTCDAAHSSTTDSGADAKRVNATPPVRRAVCALQVCSVCGFMPITCKTRGCGARPKSSGGSERPSVRKSTRVRKPKSISLLCS